MSNDDINDDVAVLCSASEIAAPDDATVIADLQQENAELKDKLMRAIAETENVRKRGIRDRDDAGKYAISSFARNLIEVADNLRRALLSISNEQEQLSVNKQLIEGIELTESSLLSAFNKAGLQQINPNLGDKIDANCHEVLYEIPSEQHQNGSIIQVIQTGYIINERLLRPAKVGVAKNITVSKVDNTPCDPA